MQVPEVWQLRCYLSSTLQSYQAAAETPAAADLIAASPWRPHHQLRDASEPNLTGQACSDGITTMQTTSRVRVRLQINRLTTKSDGRSLFISIFFTKFRLVILVRRV